MKPVIIFTYNRRNSLQFTIEALQKNDHALETDLYFFSDGYKSDADKSAVNAVRQYLNSVKGFKSVTITNRDENFGLAKNIITGVTQIIEKHDAVIVLEDDLVTSTNFLSYMNKALEHYKHRHDIFSISGYSGDFSALKSHKYDTYLSLRPSSWGWATWRDQWATVDWEVEEYSTFIQDRRKTAQFNRGGIDLARMLRHYFEGKNHSWAIRWSYSMYKQGKYCIYPVKSKIRNIGFGEDATHCVGDNIYDSLLDESRNFDYNFDDSTTMNTAIARQFKYQYSYTNKAIKRLQNILRKTS
ncbi:MAG: glycosyltransferase [Alphaproteobacteria bacterium]|nr:glycosyltransferase [Alphaproteobacteria bacterium]